MKADRFFSVHYDIRHNPKVELLRDACGGMSALGRWIALMSILYDVGGVYDISSEMKHRYLRKELEFESGEELEEFLEAAAECELIDAGMLEAGRVASKGVTDQLEYSKKKSEAGRKGNEKRWSGAKKKG